MFICDSSSTCQCCRSICRNCCRSCALATAAASDHPMSRASSSAAQHRLIRSSLTHSSCHALRSSRSCGSGLKTPSAVLLLVLNLWFGGNSGVLVWRFAGKLFQNHLTLPHHPFFLSQNSIAIVPHISLDQRESVGLPDRGHRSSFFGFAPLAAQTCCTYTAHWTLIVYTATLSTPSPSASIA